MSNLKGYSFNIEVCLLFVSVLIVEYDSGIYSVLFN